MKKLLALTVLSLSAAGMASPGGFKSLRCDKVLGPVYEAAVSGATLVVAEKRWRNESDFKLVVVNKHAFPLSQCRFEPFGINLSCRDKKASLKIVLSEQESKVSGKYHAVDFNLTGVPKLKSFRFETVKVDMGKSARCYVNGVFEVK